MKNKNAICSLLYLCHQIDFLCCPSNTLISSQPFCVSRIMRLKWKWNENESEMKMKWKNRYLSFSCLPVTSNRLNFAVPLIRSFHLNLSVFPEIIILDLLFGSYFQTLLCFTFTISQCFISMYTSFSRYFFTVVEAEGKGKIPNAEFPFIILRLPFMASILIPFYIFYLVLILFRSFYCDLIPFHRFYLVFIPFHGVYINFL